jgi:hypothetical protein
MNKTTYLLMAVAFAIFVLVFISPVFSQSPNPCSSCHSGYYQYLDILEGNSGNIIPTTIDIGQTKTVTVVIQNNVNIAKYTDLSTVSLTLTSQSGHFSVTTPTYSIGTLHVGTATATWQITGKSSGNDALIITASGKNTHNNLAFSDSYSPSQSITIQSPPPPTPTTYSVTIQLSPDGTTSPSPGILTYTAGSTATFNAIPNTGYLFDHWTINTATDKSNPITTTINSDVTLTPFFASIPTPSPTPPPPPATYTVTVLSSPNGTTMPAAGIYTYMVNNSAIFTATPISGYQFDYWLVNGISNLSNPMTQVITSDLSVNPVFSLIPPPPPPPHPTTYNITIQSSLNGTTIPTAGTYAYNANSSLTLTAIASANYTFNYWLVNGIANTSNPMNLTITSSYTVSPVFSQKSQPPPPPPSTFKVSILSNPNGTTTPGPGIYNYTIGTFITITATPNASYLFDYWTANGVTNSSNPIIFTVSSDLTVSPNFRAQPPPPLPPTFVITIQPSANGTTTPSAGSYIYQSNSTITITANANLGFNFDYWKVNGVISSNNPLTINASSDLTITPFFAMQPPPQTPNVTIVVQPTPNGTTTPSSGIYTYQAGSTLEITASPNASYTFDHWLINGAASSMNPINTTITANLQIQPIFIKQADTITSLPTFTITVQSSSNGTTTPPSGSYTRVAGDTITLTALPNDNYKFEKWLIDSTSTSINPITITVNNDTTILPIFNSMNPIITNTTISSPQTNQTQITIMQTISPLKVVLITPTFGNKWQEGGNYNIEWNTIGGQSPLTVDLQYLDSKSNQTWQTISVGLPSNGSFNWSPPSGLVECYIRVNASDNSTSPQTFTAVTKVNIEKISAQQQSPIALQAIFISIVILLSAILIASVFRKSIRTKISYLINEMISIIKQKMVRFKD